LINSFEELVNDLIAANEEDSSEDESDPPSNQQSTNVKRTGMFEFTFFGLV